MDPKKIEEADREFVKKLHLLRSKLADRQTASEQNRSGNDVLSRTLVFVVMLLFIAGIGFVAFYEKQNDSPAISRLETSQFGKAQHRVQDMTNHPDRAVPERAGRPDTHKTAVVQSIESEKIASSSQGALTARVDTLADRPDNTPDNSIDEAQQGIQSVPEPVSVAEAEQQVEQDKDEKNFELVSAVVCEGVRNHRHLDKKNRFNLTKARRAYVWMEVRSNQQPFVMRHVYYLNGRKYCEVPLKIRYPRMRTWSYVTLRKANHAGAWTVEIVCDGRVLETVGFQVSPDDAIAQR
jgi:multidrug efflux pump subunit AcrB